MRRIKLSCRASGLLAMALESLLRHLEGQGKCVAASAFEKCLSNGHQEHLWPPLRIRTSCLRGLRRRVQRPVFYALYFSAEIFGTSIPPALWDTGAGGRPNALILWIMSRFVPRALMPDRPDRKPLRRVRRARFWLFVRSHWLRMPPFMLARHLLIKAIMGLRPKKSQ